MLLDFKPPRFKRNTFFEKIVTVIETLGDMGVEVLSYQCSVAKDGERLTLVTENEVVAAYKTKEKMGRRRRGRPGLLPHGEAGLHGQCDARRGAGAVPEQNRAWKLRLRKW